MPKMVTLIAYTVGITVIPFVNVKTYTVQSIKNIDKMVKIKIFIAPFSFFKIKLENEY